MRKLLILLLATLLMAWTAAAQEGAAAPATRPPSGQGAQPIATPDRSPLPNGLALEAELEKSVDSKKAKVGDEVLAKTATDMLNNGQIVIPRGSKVVGHVTAAQPSNKGGSSSLAIAFDKIVMKKGQEIPMHAVMQAIAKPVENLQTGQDEGGGGGMGGGGGSNPRGAAMGGMGRNTAGAGQQGGMPSGGAYPGNAAGGSDPNGASQGGYGRLTPNARGITGYSNVTISETNGAQGTVLSSSKGNVHLDSGTQLVLRVVNQ